MSRHQKDYNRRVSALPPVQDGFWFKNIDPRVAALLHLSGLIDREDRRGMPVSVPVICAICTDVPRGKSAQSSYRPTPDGRGYLCRKCQ